MSIRRFENDVKMYGTQTKSSLAAISAMFENDVKMYGTQTMNMYPYIDPQFENDVKMYGTQTIGGDLFRPCNV